MPREDLVEAFMSVSRALVGIAVHSIESAQVPVTVVQHRCLVILSTEGPLPVGAIAEELGVNQSNASRLCDRLERLGLVRRTPSERDGRSVTVQLTEGGLDVLEAVFEVRRREIRAVLERMELGDADAVVAALAAFSDAAHASPHDLPAVS